jgi:hypothetical protein
MNVETLSSAVDPPPTAGRPVLGVAGTRRGELSIIGAAGCGRYKIVVLNEAMYTTVVNGFLRDIARDDDYQIYAVNNWCDGLDKFGAVIEALCSPFASGVGSIWLPIYRSRNDVAVHLLAGGTTSRSSARSTRASSPPATACASR